jgi:cytochrome b subunit of formate dehydrogenase
MKVNYVFEILLVICLIFISVTGLVLYFAFVSGAPGVGRTVSFLGTSKIQWLRPHAIIGLLMIFLMFVHLIMHFNLFKAMTKNLFKAKEKI